MSESFDEKTEGMIFWGFLYCLGRASYVVPGCADYLIGNWQKLSPWCRAKIHEKIKQAFESGDYGHESDREEWQRVLDVPVWPLEGQS